VAHAVAKAFNPSVIEGSSGLANWLTSCTHHRQIQNSGVLGQYACVSIILYSKLLNIDLWLANV
jgi:hypothetical protein